jgi:hypothetical protein
MVAAFLRDELNAEVNELYNSKATKENILKAITALSHDDRFKEGDAVLFFFSGLAGKATKIEVPQEYHDERRDSFIGTICPVDTNEVIDKFRKTGISDSTLVGLFDQVSRTRGNNMVSEDALRS